MTQDVGTTPRKPLSPKQRLAVFEREGGICCICKTRITGRDWIDEHKRALGLGGGNEPDNRGVAHIACADLKTNGAGGDREMIDRAKRVKRKEIGCAKPVGRQPEIKSAPMVTTPKAAARAGRGRRPSLPPRPMFRTIEQDRPR